MDWPSERINQGGFLHSAKVEYSKETQNLMKILMEESRLTMLQRKKINEHMNCGDSLPVWQHSNQNSIKKSCDSLHFNRTKSCRRRSLESILESNAFDVEKFVFKNAYKEPSEKAKIRLQHHMSDCKVNKNSNLEKQITLNNAINNRDNSHFDYCEEIVKEIDERIKWLEDMEKLGAAKNHRLVIQSQIQNKLAELRRFEKKQN
ncbi:UPF0193 protein EVG1 homolog [Culicoides brevitarsis]|uniref:UPF0193 protein EVG1 homolog n=1 Tax=Culicoides brevitarsis TaxID=469753 RepID=UPI00307B7D0E